MSDYPPYHRSSTDADLLPVVDEHDRVTGALPRREVHLGNLRHRAVHIVVVNSREEVLLQLRSESKDSHPGYWDISVGGHVDVGEEYDAAAVRELREELGVEGELREAARREAGPDSGWEFVRIYECRHEGPFHYSAEEIAAVRWVPLGELFRDFEPHHANPERRVTGSGWLSIEAWAGATGRMA